MQLGPFRLENPWILAPMAGVSEMPYRVIARNMGASAAPTELVSAKGLLTGQERTARYLAHSAIETPFWVQIFGGDPEIMGAGARAARKLGADIIDINMGCPVKKVTRNGAGSALLQDPERAARIVEAIRTHSGLPVTVKIRAGWDDLSQNYVDLAKAVERAGASAVAMHARTRAQGYTGTANWDLIADLVNNVSIPVIGNGDIWSAADAKRMMAETGCDAVMIGRGALGNPWIFAELTRAQYQLPSGLERWEQMIEHFNAHLEFIDNELRAVRRFRTHLQWYVHGLSGSDVFLSKVNRVDEPDRVRELSKTFFLAAKLLRIDRQSTNYDTRSALG